MSKIYLINVGANVGHKGKARSPIFPDGSFEYVSFPDHDRTTRYPNSARRFVRPGIKTTHLDPDWSNLTYGDFCKNRRAKALANVEPVDILLFWGLLWRIPSRQSNIWMSEDRGWYLMGAMRVKLVLSSGQTIASLPAKDRERLRQNDHVRGQRVEGREHVRVFLADPKYSRKFGCAVDLQIYADDSLLIATVKTSDGRNIMWYERPRWNSVTRACRAILDLSDPTHGERAQILRDAIRAKNRDYDLLKGSRSAR
jgi:hypothetical protein